MTINQKDIVLLPYPFSNLKDKKIRPALIISNNSFNGRLNDCVALPLTTVIKTEPYSISINNEDLSSGKLLKESRIRVDKIFTVEKNLISMKIGTVKDDILKKIKLELLKIF